jgi:hypothetical protein
MAIVAPYKHEQREPTQRLVETWRNPWRTPIIHRPHTGAILLKRRSGQSGPFIGGTMWIVRTSDGRQFADICSEADARRAAHMLGVTQLRGPYSWDVVDNLGRRFVAEIKHRPGRGS